MVTKRPKSLWLSNTNSFLIHANFTVGLANPQSSFLSNGDSWVQGTCLLQLRQEDMVSKTLWQEMSQLLIGPS